MSNRVDLLAGNVTAKGLGLDPVHQDEDTVAGWDRWSVTTSSTREQGAELTAEAHAEVGATPEEVGQSTASGEVTGQPGDIGDSLLASNVCQGALVGVLKGRHLLDSPETLLEVLDLGESLVALLLVGGLLLDIGQAQQCALNLLGLGHLVEEAGEEGTFLSGDLGRGGVVCNGAVTDGPDVLGTLDDQVLVDGETTAGVLLSGDLGHEVLDDGAESITGGPNEETEWDLLENLLAVRTGGFGLDELVGNPLDHGLGADLNGFLLEGLLGVVDQLLGEHGKDL